MTFFQQLNFTSSNEDGRTELEALCQTPPTRLLCLSGSGTRAFDMLLGDPEQIIALDMNPAQNELLRLKIAAFQTLDDEDLFAYLGITGTPRARTGLHHRVERALSPPSRQFWNVRARLISRGVWYVGLWEKVLRFGARGTQLIRGRHLDDLFAASTLQHQERIWADHFDDWMWRASLRLFSRRSFWTHVVGEPGGAYLPSPVEVERRLRDAFSRAAATFFFRNSDFAWLIFRGRHATPSAVPLHLRPGKSHIVRQRLERIRVVNGGLSDLSALGIRQVDAFSLSDFGSYCGPEGYARCWAEIIDAAAPQARVCERIFLNALPHCSAVSWDEAKSKALTAQDTSIVYRVRTGVIPAGAAA